MLAKGTIPLSMHAAFEPILAALLIGAPFLFGFSDESAPTAVFIIAGVLVLVVSMSTKWRLSLVKIIPIEVHALLDLGLGAALIASPFLFGYSDVGSATALSIVIGLGAVLGFLGTRWEGGSADTGRGSRKTPVGT